MRDIRQDLQERLKHVEDELHVIEGKYNSLQTLRDTLKTMLAAETERWSNLVGQTTLSFVNGNGVAESAADGTTLSIILQDYMRDRKVHHLSDLSEAAEKRGYPFGDKSPGRVVHFALLGMKSGQVVEQMGDGYWRLASQ